VSTQRSSADRRSHCCTCSARATHRFLPLADVAKWVHVGHPNHVAAEAKHAAAATSATQPLHAAARARRAPARTACTRSRSGSSASSQSPRPRARPRLRRARKQRHVSAEPPPCVTAGARRGAPQRMVRCSHTMMSPPPLLKDGSMLGPTHCAQRKARQSLSCAAAGLVQTPQRMRTTVNSAM
jgi:hypothetical protein